MRANGAATFLAATLLASAAPAFATCPGFVLGVGSSVGEGDECTNKAIPLALEDGRMSCPGQCSYRPGEWVYQVQTKWTELEGLKGCTVTLRIPCTGNDPEPEDPEPTPEPEPDDGVKWWQVLAGAAAVVAGVVAVALVFDPVPGDEVVVGTVAAKLATVAAGK